MLTVFSLFGWSFIVFTTLLMDVTDQAEQPSPLKDEPDFDPSKSLEELGVPMIGIIKRKALIKELAAAYHSECLAYCQKLQQHQRRWEEVCTFT
ncbi:hypothetical protein ZIOFF_025694 [Zingiber officinale]|uniref:Uncharacterized protein n=1 Tax=Zingiber officinale TaxID=94328 RepID=A0A8J5GUH9_ZINOF|nr:hypothetical protein ZIOFF_025694 [Zingiber officinale]